MPRWIWSQSRVVVVVCAAVLGTAPSVMAQTDDEFVPVTDAMLQSPGDADWLMWRRTLDGWGYSPLQQVNRTNVQDLQMVWSRALYPGRQQATPLDEIATSFPHTPKLIRWSFVYS